MPAKPQYLKQPEIVDYKLTQPLANTLCDIYLTGEESVKLGGSRRIQAKAFVKRGLAYWDDRSISTVIIEEEGIELAKLLIKLGIVKEN